MKKYSVKEIFYTLQGEGFWTGTPSIFVRFSGCNYWSGREEDKAASLCPFCDTDFVGTDGENGGKLSAGEIAIKAIRAGKREGYIGKGMPGHCVLTGGEPTLQLTSEIYGALHQSRFRVAVETNGSNHISPLPRQVDWVTLSPKVPGEKVTLRRCNELKLLYPLPFGGEPEDFLSEWKGGADHFYLSPIEDENWEGNTQATIDYCMRNPRWRLSLQTHKVVGLP